MKNYLLFIIIFLAACFDAPAQKQVAKSQKKLPVGIFDSGTGGLTVLQAMLTLDAFNNKTGEPGTDGKPDFENEIYQYLADQANMPYGNYAAERKTDLLKEHILKNMQFLAGNTFNVKSANETFLEKAKPPVKMIVLACNTATAYALQDVRNYLQKQQQNIPVIGVIDAGAKAALQYQQKQQGTIGVFATAGTVASEGYPNTLKSFAANMNMPAPEVVSQGGVGLAESIDRDWSYYSDTLTMVRTAYKGPSIKSKLLPIDTLLLNAYHFNKKGNELLCETDGTGNCLDMQLNEPANYVRYHLVTLLEKMRKQQYAKPLNTLILGCTHYPYLRDTIASVLYELYNYSINGNYPYRNILSDQVELIDPSVETAKEAYIIMREKNLQQKKSNYGSNNFFISVPNTSLPETQLQADGWFTYTYKYGRIAGANKKYVEYVPFDTHNVSAATYQRFKLVLPDVYKNLQKAVAGL